MKKYKCPCCGYYTLEDEEGHFDICPVCFWEDVFCKKKMHKVAKKNTQYCKKKYTKNVYFFIDSLLSVLLCNFDRQILINGCGVSICQS